MSREIRTHFRTHFRGWAAARTHFHRPEMCTYTFSPPSDLRSGHCHSLLLTLRCDFRFLFEWEGMARQVAASWATGVPRPASLVDLSLLRADIAPSVPDTDPGGGRDENGLFFAMTSAKFETLAAISGYDWLGSLTFN